MKLHFFVPFKTGIDDISRFNDAVVPFGLQPTRSPDEARSAGRYALENDEHVDVLVARSVPTTDGTVVNFETLWARRRALELESDVLIQVPTVADLILTKRFSSRPKDLEDIRLLQILEQEEPS